MAEHPLLGPWRLVAIEAHDADGHLDSPCGANPIGFITDTADGRR